METKYFSDTLQKLKEMVVLFDNEKQNETESLTQCTNIYGKTSAYTKIWMKENEHPTVDDFNRPIYETENNKQGNHIEKGRCMEAGYS